METIVIKFGGSSVADNSKLQLVANKVIKLYCCSFCTGQKNRPANKRS